MSSKRDDLPPALPRCGGRSGAATRPSRGSWSSRSACRCWRRCPTRCLALWLKLLADGVLAHDRRLVMGAAVGLGVSAPATWFLRVIGGRVQRYFRDRLTIALESHVARLQAAVATIEHHERPEYLNRLAMLRDQVFVLDHIFMSMFSTCGWILRLGVTVALLIVDPPGARRCWRCSRCRRCSPPRGGRAWSGPPRSGPRRRTGWRGTCS